MKPGLSPPSVSRRRSAASGARSNTAIATIVTAEADRVGRFAPTPSGPLHIGSLLAAVGSWLDVGPHGSCLLRIDDLDRPRCRPEHEQAILASLEAFGLTYPSPIENQSARSAAYAGALRRLGERLPLFLCDCSRRELAGEAEPCCVRDCRRAERNPADSAVRADLSSLSPMRALDRSLGEITFDPGIQRDVIVRRRDGIAAYHLACVIDDAWQGVTHVVRGSDLLASSGWQLALHQALGLTPPTYLHLPVVVEADGRKLAKSRHAMAADPKAAPQILRKILNWLRQDAPPTDLESVAELLSFAKAHWEPGRFTGLREVTLAP